MINRIQDGSGNKHSLAIPYAVASGTASAMTATIDGVTLTSGTMISLYTATANTASATLNINSLGAKPIYYQGAAIGAGRFPAKATVLLVYQTDAVASGAWNLIYSYDSNSDTDAKTSSSNSTSKIYLVGATTQSTSGQTTYSNANVYTESNELHTPKVVVTSDSYGDTLPASGVEGQLFFKPISS